MNNIWKTFAPVLYSKKLTADEKILFFVIDARKNAGNYCTSTNLELAKVLGTTEKTIATRISSMKEKGVIGTCFNAHKHRRQIYLRLPGDPSLNETPPPTDDDFKKKQMQFELTSTMLFVNGVAIDLKKIAMQFKTEIETPEVSNKSQSEEQKEFVKMFRQKFPNKAINCNVADYPRINYMKLIQEIENSTLLKDAGNLTLKWCMDHSEKILNGTYRKISKVFENFKGRSYEDLDINALFQSIDDIEI